MKLLPVVTAAELQRVDRVDAERRVRLLQRPDFLVLEHLAQLPLHEAVKPAADVAGEMGITLRPAAARLTRLRSLELVDERWLPWVTRNRGYRATALGVAAVLLVRDSAALSAETQMHLRAARIAPIRPAVVA